MISRLFVSFLVFFALSSVHVNAADEPLREPCCGQPVCCSNLPACCVVGWCLAGETSCEAGNGCCPDVKACKNCPAICCSNLPACCVPGWCLAGETSCEDGKGCCPDVKACESCPVVYCEKKPACCEKDQACGVKKMENCEKQANLGKDGTCKRGCGQKAK